MLLIELSFPAGRYHATPWGRNVNEGVAEWPPSPYRLARAIIDVWKRRRPDWPFSRVFPIFEALSDPPHYALPPATTAHTRSFLNSNLPDPTAKQLVFDAFVAVEKDQKVLMRLSRELAPDAVKDLEDLLSEMNYLGRSESWVSTRVETSILQVEWNSGPMGSDGPAKEMEVVQVAAMVPPSDYKSGEKASEGPESWLTAVCMTTAELLSDGWSTPPAMRWVDYVRRKDALQPKPKPRPAHVGKEIRCARYALHSKVLPSVKDTLPFAERIRAKLMGIHRRIMNGDGSEVSRLFSGKTIDGQPLRGHQHVFYQPLDEDGDGRLDHLVISSSTPLSRSELTALDRLQSIWQHGGRPDVQIVLTSLSGKRQNQSSKTWVSVTPFVTKRHYRKGRGPFGEWLNAEVVKECAFHSMQAPVRIEWIPTTLSTVRPLRWAEFVRSRKKAASPTGYGCKLEFDQSVPGPFALGAGCHFGLGLFKPA